MAATAASSAMTREGWCLAALPGALSTRITAHHHHRRAFLRLCSRPICLSLRKTLPLAPLVARTSDWAPQQGEEEKDNEATVAVEEDKETKVMVDEVEEDKETKVMVDEVEEDKETKVMVDEGEEVEVEGEEWENAEEEYEEWQKGPEARVEGVEEVGGDEGGVVEESYPEPPEEAKLFVGNLSYDMDSESLAKLFDQAGIVEIAEVIYNRETDQSRGFGFITMSTIEAADKAIEMFHSYDCNGRLLTVNRAAPRGSRPERPPRQFEPSFRVYVGNLPWQVDDVRLEQVFSEHGKVVDARVIYDRESGRSRGFGFVTMSTREEVDDAIAALDGQSLDGRAVRVNIAEERPRRGPF